MNTYFYQGNSALRITVALILSMLFVTFANVANGAEQSTFATPEEAVEALTAAIDEEETDDLLKIFGQAYEQELLGVDRVAGLEERRVIGRAMRYRTRIVDDGKDRKSVIVGSESWPIPFPLIKENRVWLFDTEAGIEEVVNRRIGRNELSAIDACRKYIAAQVEYSATDHDGDEVLEYAQIIISTEGNEDGLFWEAEPGEAISPFGPFVADAAGYNDGRDIGDPFKGYYYKILTRQDASAPGGRYDYMINGNMIAGFGLIAFPAEHGNSGVKTFMCNHLGKVLERDLGPDGDLIAAGIDAYSEDSSWTLVEN